VLVSFLPPCTNPPKKGTTCLQTHAAQVKQLNALTAQRAIRHQHGKDSSLKRQFQPKEGEGEVKGEG